MAKEMIILPLDLTGEEVSFQIGLPSVKAYVLGLSPNNEYILYQSYTTVDKRGKEINVENYYYRNRDFIERYWLDNVRPSSKGDDTIGIW